MDTGDFLRQRGFFRRANFLCFPWVFKVIIVTLPETAWIGARLLYVGASERAARIVPCSREMIVIKHLYVEAFRIKVLLIYAAREIHERAGACLSFRSYTFPALVSSEDHSRAGILVKRTMATEFLHNCQRRRT